MPPARYTDMSEPAIRYFDCFDFESLSHSLDPHTTTNGGSGPSKAQVKENLYMNWPINRNQKWWVELAEA